MRRLGVLLIAFLLAFAVGMPAALAGPATIENYCNHPTYAPGGTNGKVIVFFPNGSYRHLYCGSGAGNVYVTRTVVPTRFVWSNGYRECRAANVDQPSRTSYARVWTVSSCSS